MRDLSLRHSYSSLQSKMAHLAMNGLLLQGRGLFCVFLLPLSSSNSLKVIHYYYILNAPVFFSLALPVPSEIWNGISTSQQHYCIHVPHWLLYFKVIFPQNLFRMPMSSTTPIAHEDGKIQHIIHVYTNATSSLQQQMTSEIIFIWIVAIIRIFSLTYYFYFCL